MALWAETLHCRNEAPAAYTATVNRRHSVCVFLYHTIYFLALHFLIERRRRSVSTRANRRLRARVGSNGHGRCGGFRAFAWRAACERMKFGKYLRKVAYPSWAGQYVDYKLLKKHLKPFEDGVANQADEDRFLTSLHAEIDKVFWLPSILICTWTSHHCLVCGVGRGS